MYEESRNLKTCVVHPNPFEINSPSYPSTSFEILYDSVCLFCVLFSFIQVRIYVSKDHAVDLIQDTISSLQRYAPDLYTGKKQLN